MSMAALIEELDQFIAKGGTPEGVRVGLAKLRIESEQLERELAELRKRFDELDNVQRQHRVARYKLASNELDPNPNPPAED